VPAVITQLPAKTSDNLTIIRDQIAAVLKVESAKWLELSRAAGREDEGWDLKVYVEATNPMQDWMGTEDDDSGCEDPPFVVNVYFSDDAVDGKRSNAANQQTASGVFVVDCYGHGVARAREDGGHHPGDQLAELKAQRCCFLARNILMAAHYWDLGLPGIVAKRMWDGREALQSPINERARQKVACVRLRMRVDFLEFSPQHVPATLQAVLSEVTRGPNGEVLVAAEVPTPAPPPEE
jgi:hypothetical protein